jgi:hypothetical protein
MYKNRNAVITSTTSYTIDTIHKLAYTNMFSSRYCPLFPLCARYRLHYCLFSTFRLFSLDGDILIDRIIRIILVIVVE